MILIDSRENTNGRYLIDSASPEDHWGQPPISRYNIELGIPVLRGDLMLDFYKNWMPDDNFASPTTEISFFEELDAWELASDIDMNEMNL
jgi:hypothetical protein